MQVPRFRVQVAPTRRWNKAQKSMLVAGETLGL